MVPSSFRVADAGSTGIEIDFFEWENPGTRREVARNAPMSPLDVIKPGT
ncbi:MAG: hypothetical protein ABIS51_21230 [Sphingomonas sp.]